MGKFDGYLLVSDLDGTLIDGEAGVSPANLAAIHRFVAQGGRFMVATGRTELNVGPYIQGIPRTSPWILYNGAAIYDWGSASFLYQSTLDRTLSTDFIHQVLAHFPRINIQIYSGGPFCDINPLALPDQTALREHQCFERKPLEAVTAPWLKVLFCSDFPAELDDIEQRLAAHPLRPCVHQTRSGLRHFELTAAGVNKGAALRRLKPLLRPVPCCVVAIGDYFNDIEMLQVADIPAAPDSALEAVKQHARIITVCHSQAAIADLVTKLEAER